MALGCLGTPHTSRAIPLRTSVKWMMVTTKVAMRMRKIMTDGGFYSGLWWMMVHDENGNGVIRKYHKDVDGECLMKKNK